MMITQPSGLTKAANITNVSVKRMRPSLPAGAMEKAVGFANLQCEFCQRKFNDKAYERHVDYCKKKAEEKALAEKMRSRNSSVNSSRLHGRAPSQTSFISKNSATSRDNSVSSSRLYNRAKKYDPKEALQKQQQAGTIKPKQISFKLDSGDNSTAKPAPNQTDTKQRFCTQCGWKFVDATFQFCG